MGKNEDLASVVAYMKAHWPSAVKPEWQVALEEYPAILERVVKDLAEGATRSEQFIRVAGISGSGKTTQILPAVEAYCEKREIRPILLAARRFVEYHPHYTEILEFYGAENVRKMTDEFATIMLFLALQALTAEGYDIVLDVTLLSPEMEAILVKFLVAKEYELLILMVAVSPAVTEHFLAGRAWRHTRKTEEEFIRSTSLALEFYAEKVPETRIVIWNVYDQFPAYDGPVAGCLASFEKFSKVEELPRKDDEARRQAKVEYLAGD